MILVCRMIGLALSVVIFGGIGLAAEPAEVEKFVKARIDVGEMMTSYFQGGARYKEGQRPSPEQMKEMGADINARLSSLLSAHGLTIEEYRKRSPEVFADEAAVKGYLDSHHDLKVRYEALPIDRMGRGGSGRGY